MGADQPTNPLFCSTSRRSTIVTFSTLVAENSSQEVTKDGLFIPLERKITSGIYYNQVPYAIRIIRKYLKVFAVEVLKAVTFEEGHENLEHSLGVGGEAAVAVGTETLDKVRDDVVQTFMGGGEGRGRGAATRKRCKRENKRCRT